jgi:hypothetical protein
MLILETTVEVVAGLFRHYCKSGAFGNPRRNQISIVRGLTAAALRRARAVSRLRPDMQSIWLCEVFNFSVDLLVCTPDMRV